MNKRHLRLVLLALVLLLVGLALMAGDLPVCSAHREVTPLSGGNYIVTLTTGCEDEEPVVRIWYCDADDRCREQEGLRRGHRARLKPKHRYVRSALELWRQIR